MKNNNGGKSDFRLKTLEERVEKIEEKLDKIMENHLPHLELKLEKINTKLNILTAVNVGAIIIAILVNKLVL